MPSDEYSAVTGGSLKLKGVKGSKVDKQKKKRSKKPKEEGVHAEANKDDGEAVKRNEETATGEDGEDGEQRDLVEDIDEIESSAWSRSTKTEAEIRYEERRRKMLNERLKREGVKSHKERVEDLNRYLSTLSEHHDMPRIGPG